MGDTIQSNIINLPNEVLINILQLTASSTNKKTLCACALVCKALLNPAHLVLYSSVKITTLYQLEKFYNTVERSPYLGRMVKVFVLNIYRTYNKDLKTITEEISNLFSSLLFTYLPNLIKLEDNTLESYVHIFNALNDSKLKHLEEIKAPFYEMTKNECANYISCVLLMHDRVKRITITEDFKIKQESHSSQNSNRLYDKLNQFHQLVDLDIKENTAGVIEVLEHVLHTCKSLKRLDCKFYQIGNANTSNETISTFIPSNSIRSLKIIVSLNDYNTLWYIMHKFPQLRTFDLLMNTNSRALLDRYTLNRLLGYASKIENFTAHILLANDDSVSQTIGCLWDETSTPGSESVELIFMNFLRSNDPTFSFVISKPKKNDSQKASVTFFPTLGFDKQYAGFLEKNGKHIGELKLNYWISDDITIGDIPEKCISLTFENCPNPHTLCIEGSDIKPLNGFRNNLCKKVSLDKLHLRTHFFCPGFLEKLSPIWPEVKQMRVDVCEFPYDDLQLDELPLRINMPRTLVGSITVARRKRKLLLKISTVNEGEYYYFSRDGDMKLLNEEEFLAAEVNYIPIYISCEAKPKQVQMHCSMPEGHDY